VTRGISSFASSTLAGTQAAMSLPNAAGAAIVPALSAAAGSHGPTVSRIVNAFPPGLVGARNSEAVVCYLMARTAACRHRTRPLVGIKGGGYHRWITSAEAIAQDQEQEGTRKWNAL
jgi:hypothetical protein